MPTTGERSEDKLIELFLTVYDERTWAGDLSARECPERVMDGGVELFATRRADGETLAIEHTLIEPFVGDKSDFHNHFKELPLTLKSDESLLVPGYAIYVDAPVNALPRGADRRGIIAEIAAWLRTESMTFPSKHTLRDCPSPSHPDGKITLRVRTQPLGDKKQKFLIVQRYGEMRIGDAVEKALRQKLPKLDKTGARRKLLMLEREQGWVLPETICAEVERLRPRFPLLSNVQVWIIDTATFDTTKEYVDFSLYDGSRVKESWVFYRGTLESISRDGMPVYS
jgi:hypothetical protein